MYKGNENNQIGLSTGQLIRYAVIFGLTSLVLNHIFYELLGLKKVRK